MPTQTNNPVSATSVQWSAPSNVLVQDDVVAATTGVNAAGEGLVVDFGAFPAGSAATVSFAIASAWTDDGTETASLNCWISPDGATKIGAAVTMLLPSDIYVTETSANRLTSPVTLAGTLSGAQAATATYLIIEQETATYTTALDFIQLTATWTSATGASVTVVYPGIGIFFA